MPRDLKLNALPRFSKTSPKFILEEHGHCEVPAGCGGVVLRWRNPRSGIPATILLKAFGTSHELFIDGEKPESGRHTFPWGKHVICLAISGLNSTTDAAFLFAALDEKSATVHMAVRGQETAVPLSVTSAADGTWKYSLTEPAEPDWMELDYDDSAWLPLAEKEVPAGDKGREYRVEELIRKGAKPLGIPVEGSQIWIRKVFTVIDPGGAP